ncbi:TPA: hypothetical protein G5T75_004908 [Salmonella enterica]|uniref:Uncharacterized protein n=1 Tax=Salmonella enterica TaxID=28901 RepID=A0A754B8D4_SALER|nr:hypothetical protein [Salmonella enterica]EDU1197051.1 hypothetical protein [Salmonella enterica subsp. enterica serovar Heidelberg str. CFSAN000576]HAF8580924.1 hypothetical protein [Salmonella enterica]
MNELAGLHPQISELSEYEQYLLSALLRKAAADAGRTLNITELRTVAAEFFASRQTDRKTHVGYHVTQNARQPRSVKKRFSLETCTTTTLTMNGR